MEFYILYKKYDTLIKKKTRKNNILNIEKSKIDIF